MAEGRCCSAVVSALSNHWKQRKCSRYRPFQVIEHTTNKEFGFGRLRSYKVSSHDVVATWVSNLGSASRYTRLLAIMASSSSITLFLIHLTSRPIARLTSVLCHDCSDGRRIEVADISRHFRAGNLISGRISALIRVQVIQRRRRRVGGRKSRTA